LYDRLAIAAEARGQTMHAEILARLEESFGQPNSSGSAIQEMQSALEAIQRDLSEERAFMWGLVERAVTEGVADSEVRLLKPLFPKRREEMSQLYNEYKAALAAGDEATAMELRRRLEAEYNPDFFSSSKT
jgi:enoyl-CoA hydratase/carnithine racemase